MTPKDPPQFLCDEHGMPLPPAGQVEAIAAILRGEAKWRPLAAFLDPLHPDEQTVLAARDELRKAGYSIAEVAEIESGNLLYSFDGSCRDAMRDIPDDERAERQAEAAFRVAGLLQRLVGLRIAGTAPSVEQATRAPRPDRPSGAEPARIQFPPLMIAPERVSGPMAAGVTRRIATLLPPPPALSLDRSCHMAWISGTAWHELALGMKFHNPNAIDPDDMMDLETEIHGNTAEVLEWPGVKPAQDPEAAREVAQMLSHMGFDVGVLRTDRKACEQLASAISRTLEQNFREEFEALADLRAEVVIGDDLADVARAALDVEALWIGPGLDGDMQNVSGSISPWGSFHEGLVLERAAFLHLASGDPLPRALMTSLVEIRAAMAARALGSDNVLALSDCENVLYQDYDRPLEDYVVHREPVYEP